jgi:predicted TIM-barrel fold metal-dependent hydrolase
LLRSEYDQWLQSVTSMIAPLSVSEQEAIMGGNAARIYLK